MTDPNDSLLAMFDPFSAGSKATPAPESDNRATDKLTMSTFFNRIGARPVEDVPQLPKNHNNLIDFSLYNAEAFARAGDATPTKPLPEIHRGTQYPSLLDEKGPVEMSRVPSSLDVFKVHQEVEATNVGTHENTTEPPAYSPPKRNKQAHNELEVKSSRRSSLDISTLTWRIKDRLQEMSFDILRDEVTLTTEITETEPAGSHRFSTKAADANNAPKP